MDDYFDYAGGELKRKDVTSIPGDLSRARVMEF